MGSDRGPDPLAGQAGRDVPEEVASRSRLLGAVAYALAGFSGLVLLVLQREDRYVQFHALQSVAATVVALGIAAALWILSFFPLLGFLYGMLLRLLQLALFLLWLLLLWQAHRGCWFRLPYLGRWVERQVL
ncbi:MAG: hypothetical protein GF346_07440 [Candidatus Eisenbacteria bacterium]|nr:hypothetical protein [Candidatus Latescibacterota bacterium]MBD3302265.1 hypothetical protein [Candidatus Eisenbacteria bacterium]